MHNLTTVPVSVCFIIDKISENGFNLWLQKRDDLDQSLDNKWEAPGGKWEVDETPEQACLREVKEETGVDLNKVVFFKDYSWENKDKLIVIHTYISRFEMSEQQGKWFRLSFDNPLAELRDNIPPINHLIIEEMSKYIQIYKENLWEA